MVIRSVIFVLICSACQSGRIPCPEVKYASLKKSTIQRKSFLGPVPRVVATTKSVPDAEVVKREVNLEQLKSSKTTGKQMLERYGTVDEWDCPNPNGKKRYSKVTKENIRKNEKKMREHLKNINNADTLSLIPFKGAQK